MEKAPKKNTKWIIIGSIVFILAILVAVGPMLIMKYMRTKWGTVRHYTTSALLINVAGELKKTADNNYYVKGDNGAFYALENIEQDISNYVDGKCSIIGKFREAKNGETVDGNPVRLFVGIKQIVFKDDTGKIVDRLETDSDKKVSEKKQIDVKEKSLKKAQLRVKANTILNKPILFDVIEGKVVSFNRTDLNGVAYTAYVLVDEFGDNYMLYKKGKDFSSLENKDIVCLGREIKPPNNFPLVVDETTFEIYEIYDTQYNKLM